MKAPGDRGAFVKGMAGALALIGAGLTLGCVVHFGWRPVVRAFDVLGWTGFVLFCAYTLALFVLLGFCWFIIVPDLAVSRLPAFVFGRLMREAAADTLPFSQLGGFVLGARGAVLLGAPAALVTAASIVDIGAEIVGQLLFTLVGALIALRDAPVSFPRPLVAWSLAMLLVSCAGLGGLFIGVRRTESHRAMRRVVRLPSALKDRLGVLQQALKGLSRRPARALASSILHFTAWIAAAGGVWLILHFMQTPIRFGSVIALESLVYLLRSAAFAVPGAIGVLEGGYVLLGPTFGLSPEAALSLSLIKRGRDLAIGLPVLLIWQVLEGRRVIVSRLSAPSA